MDGMADHAVPAAAGLGNMKIMKIFQAISKICCKRSIRKHEQIPFMAQKAQLVLIFTVFYIFPKGKIFRKQHLFNIPMGIVADVTVPGNNRGMRMRIIALLFLMTSRTHCF